MPSVAPPLGSGKKMMSAFAVYSKQNASSNGLKKVQKKNKKKGSMSGSIKKLLGSSSSSSVSDMLLTITNQTKSNGKNKPIIPKGTPQLAKPDHKKLSVKKSGSCKANANGKTVNKNGHKSTSSKNDAEASSAMSVSSVANSTSVLNKGKNGHKGTSSKKDAEASSAMSVSSVANGTSVLNKLKSEKMSKSESEMMSMLNKSESETMSMLNKSESETMSMLNKSESETMSMLNKSESETMSMLNKFESETMSMLNKFESETMSMLNKFESKTKSKSVSKLKKDKETLSKNLKSKKLAVAGTDVASSLKVKKVKKNAPKLPLDATLKELELEGVIKMVQKRRLPSFNGSLKSNSKASKNVAPVTKLLQSLKEIADTKSRGERVLKFLLAPHKLPEFFNSYWEKKHLLIKRKDNKYFDGLFSTAVFDNILRQQHVEFTKNLDVTSYSSGVRETHNPVGRVYPPVVWDYYSNGCSLRMLNPQTFHKPVWRMLASLQDYMGSFCGANMYLTPAGTQGFAPHWDDIEAFILQLEGKKRWRVYKPRCTNEFLPRFSSANLSQEEIGEPILDTILEAGDILYFPRGFIHQGEAVEETHSLHITFSTYQKNSWADLFEKIMSSSALAEVAATNASLRQGIPVGCFNYMGSIASSFAAKNAKSKKNKHQTSFNTGNHVDKLRKEFKHKMVSLMVDAVLTDETVDRAVDEMARNFVRVALPPSLSSDEVECSVKGDGERWGKRGVVGRVEMDPESEVRLLGAHSIRLVCDSGNSTGEYRLYHSVENSREYEGREEQFVVVDEKHLPAIRHLVHVYPRFTTVEDLPLPTLEDKLTLAMALWEQHLLITELPLEPLGDDEDTPSPDDGTSSSDDE